MPDGPREVGCVPYVTGFVRGGGPISRPLIVGYEDGAVTIGTTAEPSGTTAEPSGGAAEPLWRLNVDARELFQRLFQQAEFAVEGEGICPFAAVGDSDWVPCALKRHEGGHVFRVPEQAAAPGTGET